MQKGIGQIRSQLPVSYSRGHSQTISLCHREPNPIHPTGVSGRDLVYRMERSGHVKDAINDVQPQPAAP